LSTWPTADRLLQERFGRLDALTASAKTMSDRERGARDRIFSVRVRNAGDVEHQARSKLSRHIVVRSYWKDGFEQQGIELATLHRRLVVAIAQMLPRCPFCARSHSRNTRRNF
jgi:hypothetical protein